jgi:uncharacterized DUF497 family protein
MLFSWDEGKNESNKKKHGVSFETAQLVFDDPNSYSRLDRLEGGEQRWHTTGFVDGVVMLLVVHTWLDDHEEEHIRIISARRATREERRKHEEAVAVFYSR